MIKLIKDYINNRLGSTCDEAQSNNPIDYNLPYAVVRNDGKLIHQFKNFEEASLFSLKLNISYDENGVKASSKVVHFTK